MSPATRRNNKSNTSSVWRKIKPFMSIRGVKNLVINPEYSIFAAVVLWLAEVVVNFFVIHKVKYTEIDWIAYMQEVEGVRNGTFDYAELRGDTGPLVYPAGFVWIYTILYHVTNSGKNIRLAQYIFACVYLLFMALVFRLLVRSQKVPPYVLVIMSCTSYRIHSIFVLRLFNDPIAMLLLYAAVNCFVSDYWSLGSLLYSLAVSVKMNILLFAPALLMAYIATQGIKGTVVQLIICAAPQVILALPFLLHNPLNYMIGAFNLGRVFLFKWTVNWRFLDEDLFVNRGFHFALLTAHIVVLILSLKYWWKLLSGYQKIREASGGPSNVSQLLLLPLFMSNFIGMTFARSLHYQFYVWYYHHLHYLTWCTNIPVMGKLLLLGLIELCWNTYPSTNISSIILQGCHFTLLVGLFEYLHGIYAYYSQQKQK